MLFIFRSKWPVVPFVLFFCGLKSLIATVFLKSVKLESVRIQVTVLPSARPSFTPGSGGSKLILPWKKVLESWLKDHRFRCSRNNLLCCSWAQNLFDGLRGNFVDGGVLGGATEVVGVAGAKVVFGVFGRLVSQVIGPRVILELVDVRPIYVSWVVYQSGELRRNGRLGGIGPVILPRSAEANLFVRVCSLPFHLHNDGVLNESETQG